METIELVSGQEIIVKSKGKHGFITVSFVLRGIGGGIQVYKGIPKKVKHRGKIAAGTINGLVVGESIAVIYLQDIPKENIKSTPILEI